MKKELQAILLTLVISVSVAARLSVLGWLFAIGVGSVLIIGVAHFIIHFYSMNSLAIRGNLNTLKITLSHVLFLCIFLFQSDFDDSRSYSVIEYVIGIEGSFLGKIGLPMVIASLIGYIILSILIFRNAKNKKVNGKENEYMIPSLLVSIILPFILISSLYANKDLQRTKEFEKNGEYNSIKRAFKNSDKVISLNLNNQKIKKIPNDVDKLENLEILNLIDNEIIEINPSVCNCDKLRELRIGGDIKSIPDCLKTMESLKHLSIQSQHSNELLDELRDFKNIETAHFYLKSDVDFTSMTIEEGRYYNQNSKKFDKEKWKLIKEETGIKHKY